MLDFWSRSGDCLSPCLRSSGVSANSTQRLSHTEALNCSAFRFLLKMFLRVQSLALTVSQGVSTSAPPYSHKPGGEVSLRWAGKSPSLTAVSPWPERSPGHISFTASFPPLWAGLAALPVSVPFAASCLSVSLPVNASANLIWLPENRSRQTYSQQSVFRALPNVD